jgi:hypothetical protein
MTVITVKVSNSERSLKEKHLTTDEDIEVSHNDPMLRNLVGVAIKNFGEQPDDVQINISMVW